MPSYERQLECAVAAALQAGALLREEFHRPGGPRGEKDHADLDEPAERLIRSTLAGSFPDYGYRGEETGHPAEPRDPGYHTWLVDPNDGTRDFLRGRRGSSVSIALLRGGVPVLGVVYAYCAPDSAGDLIAWAEGTGPVLRNGRPAARKWPDDPSLECTALVSPGAERRPAAYAQVLSPLRFRAVPSIAYRLALVAAGEGDLAVSITDPVGWDYGAGHALLRGAGGDLYCAAGNPMQYERGGLSQCSGCCYGGSEKLARWAVQRHWNRVYDAAREDPLCVPQPGQAIIDAGVLCRAQGCLLGQFAGDSLGSLVEFERAGDLKKRYPGGLRLLEDGGSWDTIAGQPTDDSEMALALARTLAANGGYANEAVAEAYSRWMDSGPFDSGRTTCAALLPAAAALRAGASAAQAARKHARLDSQANGALMRASPLGILAAGASFEQAIQWARMDASLTHPHRVCGDASALYAAAVSHAIRTGADAGEVYEHTLSVARAQQVQEPLLERLQAATEAAPADFLDKQGWVLLAFQNAFYQLLHAGGVEAGVVDTVMRGGDTDTNAAIAGALLGAVWGRESVPPQWRDRVLCCRPIPGLPGVRQPRPRQFWPVDAMCLAERLLLAGGAIHR